MARSLRWRLLVVGLGIGGLGTVAPAASADLISEFPAPLSVAEAGEITAGRGGMWFISSGFFSVEVNKIWRITADGAVGEFALPAGSDPKAIAAGPDGAIWYTGRKRVGRITPAGSVREFALPARSVPVGIAAGPDGALWFADRGLRRIGRIATSGVWRYFPLPRGSTPNSITLGPDQAMWFSELSGSRVGRISQTGAVRRYRSSLPELFDIAGGLDGGTWFTEWEGGRIGRLAPNGRRRRYRLPSCSNEPGAITPGRDRAMWFTHDDGIGRITTSGEITEFSVPQEPDTPGESRFKRQADIAMGSDGTIWFTEIVRTFRRSHKRAKIGRIDPISHGAEILVTKLGKTRYRAHRSRRLSLRFTATRDARVDVQWRRGCRTIARARIAARAGNNAVNVRAPRIRGRYQLRLRGHVPGQVSTGTARATVRH